MPFAFLDKNITRKTERWNYSVFYLIPNNKKLELSLWIGLDNFTVIGKLL